MTAVARIQGDLQVLPNRFRRVQNWSFGHERSSCHTFASLAAPAPFGGDRSSSPVGAKPPEGEAPEAKPLEGKPPEGEPSEAGAPEAGAPEAGAPEGEPSEARAPEGASASGSPEA
ncbi:MAG: hypothetical protein ACRDT2_22330, partial [Natronosporangium sp.]